MDNKGELSPVPNPLPEPVSNPTRRRFLGGVLTAVGTAVGIISSSSNQELKSQASSPMSTSNTEANLGLTVTPEVGINAKAIEAPTPDIVSLIGISKDRVVKVAITPTPGNQQSVLATQTPEISSARSTPTLEPSPTANAFQTAVAETQNKRVDETESKRVTEVAEQVNKEFFTQEQVLKSISDLKENAFGSNTPRNFDLDPINFLNGQIGLQQIIPFSGVSEVMFKKINPKIRSSVELSLSPTSQVFKARVGGKDIAFNLLTTNSIGIFIPDLSDPVALGIESYFAVDSLVRIKDAWQVILKNDFPNGLVIKDQDGKEIPAGNNNYDQLVMSFAYSHYRDLSDKKQPDFRYSESDLTIVYQGALATSSILTRNLEERGWKNSSSTELLSEIQAAESYYKSYDLYIKEGNVLDLSYNIWKDEQGRAELVKYLNAGRWVAQHLH